MLGHAFLKGVEEPSNVRMHADTNDEAFLEAPMPLSVSLQNTSSWWLIAVFALLVSGACQTNEQPSEWTEQFDAEVGDAPEGSRDGWMDSDGATDPDMDAGPPDLDDVVPNHCRPKLADLITKTGYSISSDDASVGWRFGPPRQGPDVELDFDGSFQGVQPIDSVVELPCPSHADALGLTCRTSQLLMFERPDGTGSRELVWLAVPVPPSGLALPPEGTEVSVTTEDRNLTVRLRPHGQVILHVGRLPREMSDQSSAEVQFDSKLGDVDFTMPADIDDPQSATCVTHNGCPRIMRLEPLKASASTTTTVETGATGTVSAESRDVKIWNVLSYRRNDDHVSDPSMLGPGYPSGYCADITYPSSKVVMARTACHESHDGVCLESRCDPQDIESGGLCTAFAGFRWNGDTCDAVQCECRGTECDDMYESGEACQQATEHCE